MLSATSNPLNLKPTSLFSLNLHFTTNPPLFSTSKPFLKPISASLIPKSTPPPQQLYQPFRPPPSPLPSKYSSLDTAARLDVLANRLGLWFEYAPLISSLYREGFQAPTIEETTGISGVEQNRLVVASQVRDSLLQSNTDPDVLSFFDTGGAELLYEIRLLSATQRAAVAKYLVENKLDVKGAQDVARAIKDFPRRRGEIGWEKFNYLIPGDCLSFMYYRQSREHRNPSEERTSALELALSAAVSEDAKSVILKELEGDPGVDSSGDGNVDAVRVPVVRLKMGEVSEASSVVVLPVCRGEEMEREILEAPWECRSVGEFGVVVAEKGWERWVVLPGWAPVYELRAGGGVVVSFSDARALPWKVNRMYKEEAILVVVDRRKKKVVVEEGFYLGTVEGEGLNVERGSALMERGVEECLGSVVLVVRPPKEETDNQLSDEDWE